MASAEVAVQQVALVACKHCKRSFTADALGRHEPVCMGGTLKNRKQFDSHRQRVEGDNTSRPHTLFSFLLRSAMPQW